MVRNEPMVEVEFARVELVDESQAVVYLRPSGSNVTSRSWLPIWMGPHEGALISIASAGLQSTRPLTHDVLQRLLAQFGLRLEHAVITELDGAIFHAQIRVTSKWTQTWIDCRPADAIALALREHAPIFVAGRLVQQEALAGPA